MMEAITQNKKLKPNFPWRALKLLLLIPLDYELRRVIAFLLKWVKTGNASKWNECNNEQVVSQDRKCKAMKSNKETNRKHK